MWISQIYDVDKYLTPHPVWIYPRWHEELRRERIWCFLPPSPCFLVFHYKLYPPHINKTLWQLLTVNAPTNVLYFYFIFLANSGLSCLWVFGHSVLLSSNHHLASTYSEYFILTIQRPLTYRFASTAFILGLNVLVQSYFHPLCCSLHLGRDSSKCNLHFYEKTCSVNSMCCQRPDRPWDA